MLFKKRISVYPYSLVVLIESNHFERYIYGGILSLDGVHPSDVFNVMVAADILDFQEIVDHLQSYLIENQTLWMEEHFPSIHNVIFRYDSFVQLQDHCTNIMSRSPEKIFRSPDFASLLEKFLIALIKRDDLRMREIDVWEKVLE